MPKLKSRIDEYAGNSEQLQQLLDANGIPINLDSGEGINTIATYNSGHISMPVADGTTARMANEDLDIIATTLSKKSGALLVSKPGESSPRMLTYNKEEGLYNLSAPIDEIKEPEKPGFFTGLLNSLFGWYKDEIESYNENKRDFERVSKIKNATGYEERVVQRKENPKYMYASEI